MVSNSRKTFKPTLANWLISFRAPEAERQIFCACARAESLRQHDRNLGIRSILASAWMEDPSQFGEPYRWLWLNQSPKPSSADQPAWRRTVEIILSETRNFAPLRCRLWTWPGSRSIR